MELRGLVRAPAERDDGRVLEQDDRVGDGALRHRAGERALERECLAVRRQAGEVEEVGAAHSAADRRPSGAGRSTRCACASYRARSHVLEPLAQVAEEAAGVGAVDEPVVVRQRDVHHRPDRDHVLAELVLDDPRPLDERVGAEDRRLRLADDRRAVERAEPARIRDRERAALHVVRQQLLRARALGEVGDRARDAEQVEVLRVLDHRDDQALAVLERDRDAEVDELPA